MSNKESTSPSFFRRMVRAARGWRRSLRYTRLRTMTAIRNRIRRWRKYQIDYILFPLGGSLRERAAPRRGFIERRLPLPSPPLSLQTINANFRRVADADNVKGVVLVFLGFSADLATLQNLRKSIQRLRDAGKTVVVYTPHLNMSHYFVATAADRIIAPLSAEFTAVGLSADVMHYKKALDRVGVQGDVIRVSPYKTAFNQFVEAEITPEEREQIDWLLDDRYDFLTAAMAEGRGMAQAQLQALIDGAPYGAGAAHELGLIDDVAYDDQLAHLLGGDNGKRARIFSMNRAQKQMLQKVRRTTRDYIGVVSIEGPIMHGTGGGRLPLPVPFLDGRVAADRSLSRLLRSVEREADMAALIIHVDSGGGDAFASDAIYREVKRLAQKKPVLVYMGDTAASGGYYIAAAGDHIMCRELTLTGSIGVIIGRLSFSELMDRLGVQYTGLTRGANAGLYSDPAPLQPAQRHVLESRLLENYRQFLDVVAAGREMTRDALEPLCGGRVWTGRQAQAHALVDSCGDFVDALQQARQLAGLPMNDEIDVPVYNFYPTSSGYTLPRPADDEKEDDSAETMLNLALRLWGQDIQLLAEGRPQYMLPFKIRWR